MYESTDDLSSLACQAAISLDNLVIGEKSNLQSIIELAKKIHSLVGKSASQSEPNPTAVVVMNRAIHDSQWSIDPLTRIEDLIQQASEITQQLTRLGTPQVNQKPGESELMKLQTFCRTLSRLALASEHSRARTRPEHPFRR